MNWFRISHRMAALALVARALALPASIHAQATAPAADSIPVVSRAGPATDATRAAAGRARAHKRAALPLVFYGALGGAALATAVFHVDPDTGGYRDGWTTATDFPDKAVHGLAAWAITNVGVDLGVRPKYSAAAVCAAGTAFEFAQGYVSMYDIAADCIGAAGAAAWQTWRARRRARTPARSSR
jgi:hypothetical protein